MFNRIGGALVAALLALASTLAHAQFADQRTYATAAAGGTANALTISIPNVVGPPKGVLFKFIPSFANTGPTQANINGTGLKNILKTSGAGPVALIGGELQPGQIAGVIYDGTQYQLVTISNAAAASVVMPPQGYLTACPQATGATLPSGCTAGVLLPTGDVTVGVGQPVTSMVYTPVNGGNQVPIWNGSQFVNFTFQELTLTIPSSRLANLIYDVCVFNNAGSAQVAFAPVWSNSNAGAGNRGTGAGSAQIERKNGIWVNSVQISAVNGDNTYVVPANQCTTVATVVMDGTNGVVSFHRTFGQSRKWSAWNFSNRLPLYLKAGDSTASWTYTTLTLRPANNNAANSLTVLSGLPIGRYTVSTFSSINSTGALAATIGVGWNNTAATSGVRGNTIPTTGAGVPSYLGLNGAFVTPVTIGTNVATMLEMAGPGNTCTWYGTETYNVMIAEWEG